MTDKIESQNNFENEENSIVEGKEHTCNELAQNLSINEESRLENNYDNPNKVVLDKNSQIVKYIVNKIHKYFGITGKINILGNDNITIDYNGYVNIGENTDSLNMKIMKTIKGSKLSENQEFGPIIIDNYKVRIDANSYSLKFHIEVTGPSNKVNLMQIIDIYEKIIIPNVNIENSIINDVDFLKGEFGLESKDSINIEDNKIEIRYLCDIKNHIDDKSIFLILNDYLPKGFFVEKFNFSIINNTTNISNSYEYGIINNDNGNSLVINIEIDEKGGVLKVNLSKIKCTLTSKLIKKIIGPFLKYIKNEIQKGGEENQIQNLKNYGITVVESVDEGEVSLEDLYVSEGLIGYSDLKEKIEDTIINPWKQKEEYIRLAKEHFANIKDIIPNAVLFEGPAGTGKTTLARIIGKHLKYPFFYIPLNSFMSKWYGESETKLSYILETIGEIAKSNGGAIVMFDEIDEIGGNRDKSHEATGKLTGVLLKKLDGMEKIQNIILVGATNRKDSLDPALISRFKHSQYFRLPNCDEIISIASFYIESLNELKIEQIQEMENQLSGRDIKAICENIARKSIKEKINNNEIDIIEEFTKQGKYLISVK